MSSPDSLPSESGSDSQPMELLAGGELHSLVLDGTTIYPAVPPSRVLYELSYAPTDAQKTVYGISKMRYQVSGDSKVTARLSHLYDFKSSGLPSNRSTVSVLGKRCRNAAHPTYKEVKASPGIGGWGSCSVDGYFRAECGLAGRLRQQNQLAWKDSRGRLVAIETKTTRTEDGYLDGLPRLDLKTVMDEKQLDLLVTCWVARVWKQACKDLKEPGSWTDSLSSQPQPVRTHANSLYSMNRKASATTKSSRTAFFREQPFETAHYSAAF